MILTKKKQKNKFKKIKTKKNKFYKKGGADFTSKLDSLLQEYFNKVNKFIDTPCKDYNIMSQDPKIFTDKTVTFKDTNTSNLQEIIDNFLNFNKEHTVGGKSPKSINFTYTVCHGAISKPNSDTQELTYYTIPDNTILCCMTNINNIGLLLVNEAFRGFSNMIRDLNFGDLEDFSYLSLISKIENIDLSQQNYQDNYKILFKNCFMNCKWFYPNQQIVMHDLETDEKSKVYQKKFFYENGKKRCDYTVSPINFSGVNLQNLIETEQNRINMDKDGINVLFFTFCRLLKPQDLLFDNHKIKATIELLMQQELYLYFYNNNLISELLKGKLQIKKNNFYNTLCSQISPNETSIRFVDLSNSIVLNNYFIKNECYSMNNIFLKLFYEQIEENKDNFKQRSFINLYVKLKDNATYFLNLSLNKQIKFIQKIKDNFFSNNNPDFKIFMKILSRLLNIFYIEKYENLLYNYDSNHVQFVNQIEYYSKVKTYLNFFKNESYDFITLTDNYNDFLKFNTEYTDFDINNLIVVQDSNDMPKFYDNKYVEINDDSYKDKKNVFCINCSKLQNVFSKVQPSSIEPSSIEKLSIHLNPIEGKFKLNISGGDRLYPMEKLEFLHLKNIANEKTVFNQYIDDFVNKLKKLKVLIVESSNFNFNKFLNLHLSATDTKLVFLQVKNYILKSNDVESFVGKPFTKKPLNDIENVIFDNCKIEDVTILQSFDVGISSYDNTSNYNLTLDNCFFTNEILTISNVYLNKLIIKNCDTLLYIHIKRVYTLIDELIIDNCYNLTLLDIDKFTASFFSRKLVVKKLKITKCPNLNLLKRIYNKFNRNNNLDITSERVQKIRQIKTTRRLFT